MYRTILIAVAFSLTAGTQIRAQKRVSLDIAAGVSFPQGALADRVGTGWHALGTMALTSPMQPMGLRFDLAHNRFSYSDALVATDGNGRQTTTSGTVNLMYRLPMSDSPMSPYLITGLGAYFTECTAGPGCATGARYGWNIGVGVRLYALGFESLAEARYHRTGHFDRDVHFFPITLGVTF